MNKIILAILILFSLISQAQTSPLLSKSYNGSGDFTDRINVALTDNSGNIYLAGCSTRPGSGLDYLTIKLNANGDTIWVRSLGGIAKGPDEVLAMALDASGNVYVTGYSKSANNGNDYLTVKYSPIGDTLWTTKYNYVLANQNEQANSIAVDAGGNVYVTGQSNSSSTATSNDDYATVKYNSAGMQQWVARYNGSGNSTDRAIKVVLDASSNVFVTGRSNNGNDDDFFTIKYNSSGALQWGTGIAFDGGSNDRPADLAIAASGNVYVTGRSNNGTNDDYILVQYNFAGVQQYAKRYDGIGAGNDRPIAMVIDGTENIYLTGQSDINATTLTNYDFVTIKYNSAGTPLWTKSYNGTANDNDVASAIAIDASGNVFVTGTTDVNASTTITNNDYATVAYNSAGTQQWVMTNAGNAGQNDKANSIAICSDGSVVVSGSCVNTTTNDDAVTIKYSVTGVQQWLKSYNGNGDNYDNVNDMTSDAAGNLYIAGYSVSQYNDRDMCTLKLNAVGDTLWMRKFSGTSLSTDEATAIVVDAAGFVYVTGFTKNKGVSSDYTTIKYTSIGDTVWVRKYSFTANQSDKAYSIALDNAGNVYVTGQSNGGTTSDDYATVKYSPAGVQLWAQRYNGSANLSDKAIGVKVSAAGNVYVTGYSMNATNYDIVTLKYNSAGVLQTSWPIIYDGAGLNDVPRSFAIDNLENLYITGSSAAITGIDDDCVTLKYNSSGVQQWVKTYNGVASQSDVATDIAVDNTGNVYITGMTDIDPSTTHTDLNCLTIKYSANGTQKWLKTFSGILGNDDQGNAITFDIFYNVYVTGQTDNGTPLVKNNDFLVISYDSTGTQNWYGTYNCTANASDAGSAIIVNYNGLYVAGGGNNLNTQKDFTILKYAAPTGIHSIDVAPTDIKIYPNPFNTAATIDLEGFSANNKKLTIQIYSSLGGLVKEMNVMSENKLIIQKDGLANGLYLIKICSDNILIGTSRFIIQ